jgi:hypothetical protein
MRYTILLLLLSGCASGGIMAVSAEGHGFRVTVTMEARR